MMLNACYRVLATESAINSESFRASLSTERYQSFESRRCLAHANRDLFSALFVEFDSESVRRLIHSRG
jgi:hypothetical protein